MKQLIACNSRCVNLERARSFKNRNIDNSIKRCSLKASTSLWRFQPKINGTRGLAPCQATIEDPELIPLVKRMDEQRPTPPQKRERLEKAIAMIDEINAQDPSIVYFEGREYPYRLLYSQWVTEWANKLDAKARDELLILARGRNVEGWKLRDIQRDNFAPNPGGARQWMMERKKWQANRLTGIMREAGYEGDSVRLVEEIMFDRDIPDPKDMREYDLRGPLGAIDLRLLEEACMIQALRDAEAIVFMQRNFPQMAENMTAEEVAKIVGRELAGISLKGMVALLDMQWTPLQRKMIAKVFPAPRRYGTILKGMEGNSAASLHPGDWRYRDFEYD